MQNRPLEVNEKTGKRKLYHYTTEHLKQVARSVDERTARYTEEVAELAVSLPKRKAVDHLEGHKEDAKHAAPTRRKAFNPEQAAKGIIVPQAGKYCRQE